MPVAGMESGQRITVRDDGRIAVLFRVLTWIVAIMMFAMMAVTFVDVVGRYVFGKPVPGGREYIEFIMGTLIFSAFPILSRDNGHITVGLFDNAFRGRTKEIKELLIVAISTSAVAFISIRLFSSAQDYRESGVFGEYLDFPIYPVVYGMSFLSFVAVGVLLLLLAEHGKHAFRK